jgi:hypothetical protein
MGYRFELIQDFTTSSINLYFKIMKGGKMQDL